MNHSVAARRGSGGRIGTVGLVPALLALAAAPAVATSALSSSALSSSAVATPAVATSASAPAVATVASATPAVATWAGPPAAGPLHGLPDAVSAGELLPRNLVHVPEADERRLVLVTEVDTQSLRVYEAGRDGPRLRSLLPCTTGQVPGDKQVEGDLKTPEGVYWFTRSIPGSALPPLYGAGAFVMDYPNRFDRLDAKTGSGIWLHGVETDDRVYVARDTRGCVALRNDHFDALAPWLRLHETPIVVVDRIELAEPAELAAEAVAVMAQLEDWRAAWEAGDHDRFRAHYDPGFVSGRMDLDAWVESKRSIARRHRTIRVVVDDPVILREKDRLWVAFRQEYASDGHRDVGRKLLLARASPDAGGWPWRFVAETWRPLKEERHRWIDIERLDEQHETGPLLLAKARRRADLSESGRNLAAAAPAPGVESEFRSELRPEGDGPPAESPDPVVVEQEAPALIARIDPSWHDPARVPEEPVDPESSPSRQGIRLHEVEKPRGSDAAPPRDLVRDGTHQFDMLHGGSGSPRGAQGRSGPSLGRLAAHLGAATEDRNLVHLHAPRAARAEDGGVAIDVQLLSRQASLVRHLDVLVTAGGPGPDSAWSWPPAGTPEPVQVRQGHVLSFVVPVGPRPGHALELVVTVRDSSRRVALVQPLRVDLVTP